MLELAAEGRDALARSNLRLAATNFALAVEALFRALLKQYFPDADPTRPSVQLLGTYFARYREIGDPVGLAISKKRALQLVKTVWEPRDELMHGHDLPLERSRIVAAEAALLDLLQLWFTRPGAEPFLIEGPFVEFGSTAFPSRNAGDLIERARNRLAGGHAQDAEEAARFALVVEPTNAHGLAILGVLSARRGQFSEAADLMQQALSLDPTLPGLADDLALVKAKLSS
jgi:tetratricopeptide (TPR) repeat protein